MLALLAAPLSLTLLARFRPDPALSRLLFVRLTNNAAPRKQPTLSRASWWNGSFPRDFQSWFPENLALRGHVVRATNQVYYSAFQRSYNADLIVGREQTLYHIDHVKAHCEPRLRNPRAHLEPLVTKIRRLQPELARRKVPLVFVVSPSKPELLGEFLPKDICPHPPGPHTSTRVLLDLLRSANIRVIDGPGLVAGMKKRDPLPPFPRGGLHWSVLTGKRLSALLLQEANAAVGADFGELKLGAPTWNNAPGERDRDLAMFLNVWRVDADYPVGNAPLDCRPTPQGQRTKLIAIGGSFTGHLLDPLSECKMFEQVTQFFYYSQFRFDWPATLSGVGTALLDWDALLTERTLLVLELNQFFMEREHAFLHHFLDDALTRMKPTASAK
jgi:hypothetical protein